MSNLFSILNRMKTLFCIKDDETGSEFYETYWRVLTSDDGLPKNYSTTDVYLLKFTNNSLYSVKV